MVIALPTATAPPRHTSYSALSTYVTCPLRYYFRHVARLPEDTIASSLVFGLAAHASFQIHFEHLLVSGTPPSLDILLEAFWDSWHEHDYQQILFAKGEDEGTMASLADRVLRAFQRSAIAQPKGKIIAIEEPLSGELVSGVPKLHARLDLAVEHDDAIEIVDLKTTRTNWSESQVTRSADQVLLYAELAKDLAGGKPLRLAFAVLTRTKLPDLMLHPVPHDPQQVERTKRIVAEVWHAIECGHFYPSPGPMTCPACPYKDPCRRWPA